MNLETIKYKIKKLFINIIYIFNSKKRRTKREELKKTYINKYITAIEKKYPDYYIFLPPHCIGDLINFTGYIKNFIKLRNGDDKIIIIVKDNFRKELVEQFPSVFKAVSIDSSIFYNILYSQKKYNNKIKKGEIHIVNPDNIVPGNYKFKSLKELYRYSLAIKLNNSEMEYPFQSEKEILALNRIWTKYKCNERTIFLSPYAESLNYKILNTDFWIKLAEKLTKEGYNVVFNAKKHAFGKYKCLYLPLTQIGPFCSKCYAAICFRSGLCDLIAIFKPKRLIAIYPKEMIHPALGKFQRNIWKNTYEFDPNLTDDQNMYKIFSLNDIVSYNNAIEIICDKNQQELLIDKCINSIIN